MAKSYVILKDAPVMDYTHDYVALPDNYGTYDYFNREDVKAIRETVFAALDDLNERTGIAEDMAKYEKVIIKPNLVNVYHKSGYFDKDGGEDFPETTDPRVFEAVVNWVKNYNPNIIIAESSGKPFPAAGSFKITHYDWIAKQYGTELVPLERRPVARYMLPKAEVMKEILIPDTFDDIVKGKAFYISVPKMKTNIYTGVTLGFKNAMGTIPYFLRERNHTHDINKKLADMLYLFKPNLTVIDGIIGGEGNTPAPVDPVDVHMIVASNQSVEADRITTYMMGFDPNENKLIQEADKRGFGDKDVEIVGNVRVTPFRPACPSVMRGEIVEKLPGIVGLAGHILPGAPKITDPNNVTPDQAFAIEQACVGGCLSSIGMGFAGAFYGPGKPNNPDLFVVEGPGIEINGTKYWFDKDGKPYTKNDIVNGGKKIMVMGKCCGDDMLAIADYPIKGCCNPAECLNATCNALGVVNPQLRPWNNTALIPIAVPNLVGTMVWRGKWILQGKAVDVPKHHEDKIFELPALSAEDAQKNYIEWPIPALTTKQKISSIVDMLDFAGSLTGMPGALKYYKK
ncbi:MAG: DUF362 domain-containing protein [Clostridia bacterium]|nr:DUF362 domain-containing protein [Clostridia bacterium]